MPTNRRIVWTQCLALCALLALPVRSGAASMELYGTFESMGVIVSLSAGEDADGDARADVSYRVAGGDSDRQGFRLTRVATDRFVGSLFHLSPGTTYEVAVTFSDPDGAPLDGTVVSGAASTRAEIALPAPSRSYHVAPTGSGTTCDAASPCALQTALGQVQAGEELLLHGGTYYQGGLSLPRSGAAGAPIVIRSNPGETAVLDGADPATFTWSEQESGLYRATVNAGDSHLVTVDGQRLYPYGSLDDLRSLAWNVPGFFANGTTVYVHLADGSSPGAHAVLVSRFNNAFTVQGRDHIVFSGLIFRHYGLGSYAKALYFNDASDDVVQGCTFAVNDLGIGLKYDSHRNVFQDNVFYDTDSLWPWEAVKGGSELETGGIRMYSPMTGRGTVIRQNTFFDYFDGFGVCPEDAGTATNETDVYENLVYDAGDDGMETDGQCSNVRIWKNTFHDVLVGISLAPVYPGPVYAFRNLIYRTGAGNSEYSGNSFKLNSSDGPSGSIYLFHNTADAGANSSGFAIMSPGSWTVVYARNNIWSGTEYALYNANPAQPLNLDRDALCTSQAGELAWWKDLADPHLNTVGELYTATGQEQHGLGVAPGFADAASGIYTLGSGSQLVDQGMVIPGVNDDYEGAAPDIGAFESSLSAAVEGTCGGASGGTFSSAPTTDLCAAGTPTSLAGAGPWSWSCRGANGGADAQCSAVLPGEVGSGGGTSGGGSGGGSGSSGGGGCATGGGALSLSAFLPFALRRRRTRAVR
jgi:hypothetical protein